jgi:hypothetical protein
VEHVVFFPGPDRAPAFHRVATLEEAVRLVEHLRNSEGITEVGVHPLGAEVPLSFRTYYRVEVPVPEQLVPEQLVPAQVLPEQLVPEQTAPAEVGAEWVPDPFAQDAEPDAGLVDASASGPSDAFHGGRGNDGVKSLGFFA